MLVNPMPDDTVATNHVTDILTKCLGSTNPHNMVRATMDGLTRLVSVAQVARERGIEVSEIRYRPRQEV